jgi:hypothetical protein
MRARTVLPLLFATSVLLTIGCGSVTSDHAAGTGGAAGAGAGGPTHEWTWSATASFDGYVGFERAVVTRSSRGVLAFAGESSEPRTIVVDPGAPPTEIPFAPNAYDLTFGLAANAAGDVALTGKPTDADGTRGVWLRAESAAWGLPSSPEPSVNGDIVGPMSDGSMLVVYRRSDYYGTDTAAKLGTDGSWTPIADFPSMQFKPADLQDGDGSVVLVSTGGDGRRQWTRLDHGHWSSPIVGNVPFEQGGSCAVSGTRAGCVMGPPLVVSFIDGATSWSEWSAPLDEWGSRRTIRRGAPGELVLAWRHVDEAAGTYSIEIARSASHGSELAPVPNGPSGKNEAYGSFSMAATADGRVYVLVVELSPGGATHSVRLLTLTKDDEWQAPEQIAVDPDSGLNPFSGLAADEQGGVLAWWGEGDFETGASATLHVAAKH